MNEVDSLDINYNKTFYFPGQILNGKVVLKALSRLSVVSFKLIAFGDSYVTSIDKSYDDSTIHTNSIDHFKYCFDLISFEETATAYLEPGKHEFTFQINLPSKLPSSAIWVRKNRFMNDICSFCEGRTKYYCHAILITANKKTFFANKSYTVIDIVNLNEMKALKNAYDGELSEKSSSCCSYFFYEVQAKIHLEKTGFVPGESIYFSLIIKNFGATVKIKSIDLEQLVCYGTTWRLSISLEKICIDDEIKKNETMSFDSLAIKIPSTCPSTLDHYESITTSYFITVKTSALKKLKFPIVIGTVPFNDNENIKSQPLYLPDENCLIYTYEKIPKNIEVLFNDTLIYKPLYPYFICENN